jgi:hypothetical protein
MGVITLHDDRRSIELGDRRVAFPASCGYPLEPAAPVAVAAAYAAFEAAS